MCFLSPVWNICVTWESTAIRTSLMVTLQKACAELCLQVIGEALLSYVGMEQLQHR